MPAGEAVVVVDLRLRLRVLCFVEALPIGILPATMDNLVQDIAVLLLYSVFTPVVPLFKANYYAHVKLGREELQ